MKLEKVIIKNFRNVVDKEFKIDTSSFVLAGRNMSGKTNTLNAIHWAFTSTDMQGSNDNRANFTKGKEEPIEVTLFFEGFSFTRKCEMVDGAPKVSVYINGEVAKTTKAGEAMLHAKLGLTDIILAQNKDFDIIKFLLNPLYFDSISPSALRKFLYMVSNISFEEIAAKQTKAVCEMLETRKQLDPYKLADAVSKDKKAVKKVIDACKVAMQYFPSIVEEATQKQKEETKKLTLLENEEALVDKYALSVSKIVNKYFENALGVKVCLLEKGVGDDVFIDVCYPILPKSGLPFHLGSQAEKTYVGLKFIQEVCKKWDIKPLPLLVDNMESLDATTTETVKELGVDYIGAIVIE